MKKTLSVLSLLASLTACHQETSSSRVNIVRGQPLAPDSPAINNVVGLAQGNGIFCTGSIVADDVIVTAAHCVRDQLSFEVVFGHPRQPIDRIPAASWETFKPYQDAAFPNFDIAWVKLKRKIPAGFAPLEILRDPELLKKASTFRLAGYGIEETGCRDPNRCHDDLLEADTELKKYHDSARLMSLLVFKGAADRGFGASCNGDSGGPAYARIDNRWYLIGVTNGATIYLNPDSFDKPSKSCEQGSDIYTYMGDYAGWLQERSGKTLAQTPELNADRAEPSILVKGAQKPENLVQPTSWTGWLEYPYHNEQAWNVVDKILFEIMIRNRYEIASTDFVRLYDDPVFSQERVEQLTALDFSFSDQDRLRFPDQSTDLQPINALTSLSRLSLYAPNARSLRLDALKNLKDVTLRDWPAAASLDFAPGTALWNLNIDAKEPTDLGWLDVKDLQSIDNLVLGHEILTTPDVLKIFQNKGLKLLDAVSNGLRDSDLAEGFDGLTIAFLSHNAITSTAFLKKWSQLYRVSLSNNPLDAKDCPDGVICGFDRILKPASILDYCQNSIDSGDYESTFRMLMNSQNLTQEMSESNCQELDKRLGSVSQLLLEGHIDTITLQSELVDATPLKALHGLKSIHFQNLAIDQSAALGALENLESLTLSNVSLKRFEFLPRLPRLLNLDYFNMPLQAVEILQSPTLQVLSAAAADGKGGVKRIGTGVNLPALRRLSLWGQNHFFDLHGVERLTNLIHLDISETAVKDFEPLSGLIGTTVKMDELMMPEVCPVIYGSCEKGGAAKRGGGFGSDKVLNTNWYSGQVIPGLSKAIRT